MRAADGVSLFHVRGSQPLDTRAVQVEETAASLNSGDCFVLLTPGTMFVWRGEGANETEAATATTVAASLQGQRSLEQVAEHAEPEAGDGERREPERGLVVREKFQEMARGARLRAGAGTRAAMDAVPKGCACAARCTRRRSCT